MDTDTVHTPLVDFARAEGEAYSKRHDLGQYFTPVAIAQYMARLLIEPHLTANFSSSKPFAVLEPSAGSGVLAAAVFDELMRHSEISHADIVMCEIDAGLEPALLKLRDRMHAVAAANDRQLKVRVVIGDFCSAAVRKKAMDGRPKLDAVILNPPYFKIRTDDPRQIADCKQNNIYAVFLLHGASMLCPRSGTLSVICPRSFTSGQHFQNFRKRFFSSMRPTELHVFEARRGIFDADILQENLIMTCVKDTKSLSAVVNLSTSMNNLRGKPSSSESAEDGTVRKVPVGDVLVRTHGDDSDTFLCLPCSEEDALLFDAVGQWSSTLDDYGVHITTGRVLPHECRQYLSTSTSAGIPLIWMQHVAPMKITWPLTNFRKEERLKSRTQQEKPSLLIDTSDIIVMRRFSPKEQERRVICAPLLSSDFPDHAKVAIENHLNILVGVKSPLKPSFVRGLAAFLTSAFFDRYLRLFSGNTQISATELRKCRFPAKAVIVAIGESLSGHSLNDRETSNTFALIDSAVETALVAQYGDKWKVLAEKLKETGAQQASVQQHDIIDESAVPLSPSVCDISSGSDSTTCSAEPQGAPAPCEEACEDVLVDRRKPRCDENVEPNDLSEPPAKRARLADGGERPPKTGSQQPTLHAFFGRPR